MKPIRALTVSALTLTSLLSMSGIAGAVANGIDAPPGTFGFNTQFTMTGIPTPDGGTRDSACSGALVAPQWIITAGHCFHDTTGIRVDGPPRYETEATVGKTTLQDTGSSTLFGNPGHTRSVIDVRQSEVNDLALAKLSEPITDLTPVALPLSPPNSGDLVAIDGWGANTSVDPMPAQHVRLGGFRIAEVADTTIQVAGLLPLSTTSACAYDSGAPYFTPTSLSEGVLVGVENDGPPCPHNQLDTAARVDNQVDWIRSQIQP
ncbi:S1 family peptidase [Rhodococcus marinonascens]|uniref:S1 family peptidase n=1 Tax=Rhodococcus marinonascens TaxID=38311 RepID=UPI000933FA9E|nr:S1 family peptidase [Rhodococcus marinonascens]